MNKKIIYAAVGAVGAMLAAATTIYTVKKRRKKLEFDEVIAEAEATIKAEAEAAETLRDSDNPDEKPLPDEAKPAAEESEEKLDAACGEVPEDAAEKPSAEDTACDADDEDDEKF